MVAASLWENFFGDSVLGWRSFIPRAETSLRTTRLCCRESVKNERLRRSQPRGIDRFFGRNNVPYGNKASTRSMRLACQSVRVSVIFRFLSSPFFLSRHTIN